METKTIRCEHIEHPTVINGVKTRDQYWRAGNYLLSVANTSQWQVTSISKKPESIRVDYFEEAYALAIYLNEQVIAVE
ncbi:hypothetical protein GI383_24970 [Salmonella enterica]|nr:hypothetical protein [Salmonella enterica]